MTIRAWAAVAAVLGGILLAIGLVFGYSSISRDGTTCGSAFGGQSDAAQVQDYTNAYEGVASNIVDDCSSALSDRKPVALVLVIPGGVLLGVAVLLLIAEAARAQDRRTQA